MTDFNLYWDKIQQGDEKALERIYKKAFPQLVLYANEITGDMTLAEEAVQDVILKIWQNRSVIIVQGSFKSYLLRAVHNQSLNAIRNQKTNKESVNQTVSEALWQFISDNYDLDDQFIDQMCADEIHGKIQKVIGELPEKCRQVFRMSRFEAMIDQEIARKLKLSIHTIKSHIYVALQRISEILNKDKD